jgi:hypothetical protein
MAPSVRDRFAMSEVNAAVGKGKESKRAIMAGFFHKRFGLVCVKNRATLVGHLQYLNIIVTEHVTFLDRSDCDIDMAWVSVFRDRETESHFSIPHFNLLFRNFRTKQKTIGSTTLHITVQLK